MENNSDASSLGTDEEEDENVKKCETKPTESMEPSPNKSSKKSKDPTDEPIMDEQTVGTGLSKHQFEADKKAVYKVG